MSSGVTGAVTLIQRFGSALNLNVHFHMLVLDRVYRREGEGRLRVVLEKGYASISGSKGKIQAARTTRGRGRPRLNGRLDRLSRARS
jgi:hypothetical protein